MSIWDGSDNVSDAAGNDAEEVRRTVLVEGINADLMLEDFESGENGQTSIAGENWGVNDGWWYGYNDESDSGKSTIEPDPAFDSSFLKIINTNQGVNDSKGLHVVFILKKTPKFIYPYCSIAFSFKIPKEYCDMSKMKEFKFMIKGNGRLRINFETKLVNEWPNVNERWGHLGKTIKITSDWQEVVIDVASMTPVSESQQAKQFIRWDNEDVRDKVTAVEFQSYGNDGDTIEVYLDDIKISGMKVSDFGF